MEAPDTKRVFTPTARVVFDVLLVLGVIVVGYRELTHPAHAQTMEMPPLRAEDVVGLRSDIHELRGDLATLSVRLARLEGKDEARRR